MHRYRNVGNRHSLQISRGSNHTSNERKTIMGKFDGYLICTDLDGTLLTDDKQISAENKKAIEYFISEGGLFTFSTGRMPMGIKVVLRSVMPNAPIVCANGASVYDAESNKFLWSKFLEDKAFNLVEYIEEKCPNAGIEINDEDTIYFSRPNRLTQECRAFEEIPGDDIDYHLIPQPWKKIVFMVEADDMQALKSALKEYEFYDEFTFLQSNTNYLEVVPNGCSKGDGVMHLAKILGIEKSKVIGIGDEENDYELVKQSGIGVAVANATPRLKSIAKWIVADNNNHAIKALIDKMEKELF